MAGEVTLRLAPKTGQLDWCKMPVKWSVRHFAHICSALCEFL